MYLAVGQTVPKTLDEFSSAVSNGHGLHKQELESFQQLLFPCHQPQETRSPNSVPNHETIPAFQSQVLMVPGDETFHQSQKHEEQLTKGPNVGLDFESIRMFPESTGNTFTTSTSTCQSLNIISQMSDSELLGIINPSTFDSV